MDTPKVVLDWLREARSGGVYRVVRKDVDFVPWAQVDKDARAVADHLAECGIAAGDRVGIRGENSYSWLVLDLALLHLEAVPVAVPVPDFAGRSNEEISRLYGLVAMFASAKCQAPDPAAASPLERVLERPPVTRRADPPAPAGRRLPASDRPHFTLAFSSGTAGRVKCLLMYWPGVQRLIEVTGEAYPLAPDDRIMIALPLSTFQQRYLCYLAIRNSCNVVLTTAQRYLSALPVGAPTFLLGPPNFYEFAATRFANEPRRRRLLRRTAAQLAVALPTRRMRQRWRRRVFRSYHDMFGGNARIMLVGSAPVRREMLEFFACAGFELHQIYGMTETGYLAWNRPGASRLGSVGRETYPGTLMVDEDGEVLIKHPWHICCGYEGEPEASVADVFRGDDVIATGDLGHLLDDYLYLKGRKKNVIVTRGGTKLALEELEDELTRAPGVHRVALVEAPEPQGFAVVAWYDGDPTAVREQLRPQIEKVAHRIGVGTRIKHLALIEGQLAQDSPLLNRNLKLDRAAVRAAATDILETID